MRAFHRPRPALPALYPPRSGTPTHSWRIARPSAICFPSTDCFQPAQPAVLRTLQLMCVKGRSQACLHGGAQLAAPLEWPHSLLTGCLWHLLQTGWQVASTGATAQYLFCSGRILLGRGGEGGGAAATGSKKRLMVARARWFGDPTRLCQFGTAPSTPQRQACTLVVGGPTRRRAVAGGRQQSMQGGQGPPQGPAAGPPSGDPQSGQSTEGEDFLAGHPRYTQVGRTPRGRP